MVSSNVQPFHLAIPVKDLESTREFYGHVLNLKEGRATDKWIDWNFFGHQLTTHISVEDCESVMTNAVDGHHVPCRHFGLIMEWNHWHEFRDFILDKRKHSKKKIEFIIEPYTRFQGEVGEQSTMFFLDFSGNVLEIKSFQNSDQIFRPYDV